MSLPRPNAIVFVLRCGRHQIPKIIHMINITRDKNGILLGKLIRLMYGQVPGSSLGCVSE